MEKVVSLHSRYIEKQHKEMFQTGSAAINLKEEHTYWKKPNNNKLDSDQIRRDMTKGYMALLSE